MSSLLHKVIKGYEIREQIGAGGFGVVYRAYQAIIGREVAIKVIAPEWVHHPDFARRFEVEAKLIARLEHPHIVPLYDYWQEDEGAFLVMRLLPQSLRAHLEGTRWTVQDTSRFVDQIAHALDVAHRRGVIHRDLKPDNVLLDEAQNAYLSDFGIAKDLSRPSTTQKDVLMGSLVYMSPEQINGDSINHQSDLYSLGIVLYEMLTGDNPYQKASIGSLIHTVLNNPLPPLRQMRPDLPPALEGVIQTATAKAPEHRYPDGLRMAAAFQAAVVPRFQSDQPLVDPLTEREIDILECLVQGLGGPQIAEALVLAPGTVKWYTKQIYGKLDVHSREDVIERAHALGLVRKPEPIPARTSKSPAPQEPTLVVKAMPSSLGFAPGELPTHPTPFIGRDHELVNLLNLFANQNTRLITLLAPGGMGKSRIALETARRLTSDHSEKVVYVPLAAISSAENLLSTVAEALHFVPTGSASLQTQLVAFLAPKSLILVLDNFEQILDAASLVSELLESAPKLRLLITSRERLNLSAETVFSIRGMDYPASVPSIQRSELLKLSAVQLFLDHAHRVRPHIDLEEIDLHAVGHICRLVEGMPLGLILAASWIDLLTPVEIVDELLRSADILESRLADMPSRLRSIRAVFESSWSRLSETEQTALARLSVFRGGFTRGAAQTVAQAHLRTLAGLINKSLLWTDLSGRYSIHELIRQYAAERLELSGDADHIRSTHSEYYADALSKRVKDLEGRNQIPTLEDIRVELENIRASLTWAVEHETYHTVQIALHPLWMYALISGRILEYNLLIDPLVALIREKVSTPERDAALGILLMYLAFGAFFRQQGYEQQKLLDECRPLIEAHGTDSTRAFWHWCRGQILPYRQSELLTRSLQEARAQYQKMGDDWGVNLCDNSLVYLSVAFPETSIEQDESLIRGQDSLQSAQERGDHYNQAMMLNVLGLLYHSKKKFPQAIACYKESVQHAQQLQNLIREANTTNNLALLYIQVGQPKQACSLLEHALSLRREYLPTSTIGYEDQGDVLLRLGEFAKARVLFAEGLARVHPEQQPEWVNIYGTYLIVHAWAVGDWQEAEQRYGDWFAAAQRSGNFHNHIEVLVVGCVLAWSRGSIEDAQTRLDQLLNLALQPGETVAGYFAQSLRAFDAQRRGEHLKALAEWQQAIDFLENHYPYDISLQWERTLMINLSWGGMCASALKVETPNTARSYALQASQSALRWGIVPHMIRAILNIAALLAIAEEMPQAVRLTALAAYSDQAYAVDRHESQVMLEKLQQMLPADVFQEGIQSGHNLDVRSTLIEWVAAQEEWSGV